jgi:hypothetical protein
MADADSYVPIEDYVQKIVNLGPPEDIVRVATACLGFAAGAWVHTKGPGKKEEFLRFCEHAYDGLGNDG